MPYTHGKSIIRVAYAESDLTLQDLIPSYIDSIENCKVVIQATSGLQLLEKLSAKPETNLVISDIVFPDMDGIETARKVKENFPEMRILFFSLFKTEIVYSRVMQVQGNGFVSKYIGISELNRGILDVMKSGHYFQNAPAYARHITLNGINGKTKLKNTFSDEEINFMKLINSEMTYKGIASKMKCGKRHLDYIREGLFQRFDVHSKAELLGIASESGL